MVTVNLLATAPQGVWESIIGAFNGAFLNYALAIIMLTLCIKLLLLPTDFLNKKVTRKNARMQAELKPDLEAIEKKYGNNPELKNQKINELYKKKGYSIGGSCGIMLLSLGLTMFVFFTLLSGLNGMADYKITTQYEQLEVVYDTSISSGEEYANEQVRIKYDEIKDSFLWIKNVWIAESPLKNPIPSFDDYKKIAKSGKVGEEYKSFNDMSETELNSFKEKYETVMSPLREDQGVNGYFILTIIVAGTSIFMQLLSQGKLSKKKQSGMGNNEAAPANKLMLFLMPALMVYICISTNAVFTLYLTASQLFSCATTPLIDLILDKLDKKNEDKKFEEQMSKKGRIVR